MKTIKNTVAAATLMAVMVFGTTFANAGIIIAGFNEKTKTTRTEPCTGKGEKVDWGIIIAGLNGIIIAGLTGIIIAGAVEEPPTNCGIIIAG
jgi:hypothetical protein